MQNLSLVRTVLLPTILHAAKWRRGTFVELGAFDGIKFSNTYALEVCFGWTGVLIEGNPNTYRFLNESSGRKAAKIHSAVCQQESGGHVDFTVSGGLVAGATGTMSAGYKKDWGGARAWRMYARRCPCRASRCGQL